MSVKQVQNKINFILQGLSQDTQFSALLYAFVTDMDLDGHNTVFIKWYVYIVVTNILKYEIH